jgi:hypothetical protein
LKYVPGLRRCSDKFRVNWFVAHCAGLGIDDFDDEVSDALNAFVDERHLIDDVVVFPGKWITDVIDPLLECPSASLLDDQDVPALLPIAVKTLLLMLEALGHDQPGEVPQMGSLHCEEFGRSPTLQRQIVRTLQPCGDL